MQEMLDFFIKNYHCLKLMGDYERKSAKVETQKTEMSKWERKILEKINSFNIESVHKSDIIGSDGWQTFKLKQFSQSKKPK